MSMYYTINGAPLHDHVACDCGNDDCGANVRITMLADKHSIEIHVGLSGTADNHAPILNATSLAMIGYLSKRLRAQVQA